jgi:hypothetical protein
MTTKEITEYLSEHEDRMPDTAGDKPPKSTRYTKKIDLDGGVNDVLDSLVDIEGTWESHGSGSEEIHGS